MRTHIFVIVATFILIANTASAAVSSQTITLAPGVSIISVPRIVESHVYSAPETLDNLAIFLLDTSRPSGWATMADLGQTEFAPLYGYFVFNLTDASTTLTLNYKASTTPSERNFSRTFAAPGLYSFGIANPTYAKTQGASVVDTDNPDHILSSLLTATTSNYNAVIDFTDSNSLFTPDNVLLADIWKIAFRAPSATDTMAINTLYDLRETKGYVVNIISTSTFTGFQSETVSIATTSATTADFSGITLPITGVWDPQSNVTLWRKNLNVGTRSGIFDGIRFMMGGTASSSDIENYRLFIDGVQYSSAQASVDNFGYISFATTTTLSPGVHEIKLMGDILPTAAGRTCQITLAKKEDIVLADAINFAPVVPTVTSIEFTPVQSGIITVNIPSDTIKPTVIINSVTEGSVLVGDKTIVVSASDNIGVTGVSFFLDGVIFGSEVTSLPYNQVFTPGNYTSGLHIISAVARDLAGNTATSSVTVYVYKTRPSFTAHSPWLPTTILSTGTKIIGKVSVAADTQAPLVWRQFVLSYTKSSNVTLGDFQIYDRSTTYDFSGFLIPNAQPLPGVTASVSTSTITFTSNIDQDVLYTKVYEIWATVSGNLQPGDFVTTEIKSSGLPFSSPADFTSVSPVSTFTWSDMSATSSHSALSSDWNNDFPAKFSTEPQTMSI